MAAETNGMEQATSSAYQARPDAKTQRYDRQLRLWAAAGQTALESAHILVVNGSPTATQTLKNLVLPGIGAFAILDHQTVCHADVGANFFLLPSLVGKPRGAAEVPLLVELNDSVKGHAIAQDIPTFLAASPTPLGPYTMVISLDAPTKHTLQLADACWKANIPLITVRSSGFIASIRTQTPEMAFVETHPDSLVDLRLDAPWPELDAYAKSLDLDQMDSAEYGHLPAVVIALRALETYKCQNDGKLPKLTKERNALKTIITSMKRQADEENFDEALALVIKLAKPTAVPPEIAELFADPSCDAISSSSAPFWLLVHALRKFVESNPQHLLPLTGALPDMKATSEGYVTLQKIYRAKAQKDLEAVKTHLATTLTQAGLPTTAIPEDQIATFVKHSGFLAVIRGTNLAQEHQSQLGRKTAAQVQAALNDESSLIPFFVALRAFEEFESQEGRWPTEEADQSKTETYAQSILSKAGVPLSELPENVADAIKEVIRAGGADLPQMAALLGGIAAQEAIKLTTRQYTALNGTLIFDGIRSRTEVF